MSHIKHLLTDPEDPEEVRLYEDLRDKYYQFLKYKMNKIQPELPEDVRFDDTYKYRYSDVDMEDIVTVTPKPKNEAERRKLAFKFHPDKCKEPDASELFGAVWNADAELLQQLKTSENHTETVRIFIEKQDSKQDSVTIDEELDKWVHSYSYNYHYFPHLFIQKDDYIKKKEEMEKYRLLQEERDELKRARMELRELAEILKEDKERSLRTRFKTTNN